MRTRQRWEPTLIASRRLLVLVVLADGRARSLPDLELEVGLGADSCYRTVRSLEDRGLVHVDRSGDRCVVQIVYPPVVTKEEPSHASS
jgi:predicted transcriptional regulator